MLTVEGKLASGFISILLSLYLSVVFFRKSLKSNTKSTKYLILGILNIISLIFATNVI